MGSLGRDQLPSPQKGLRRDCQVVREPRPTKALFGVGSLTSTVALRLAKNGKPVEYRSKFSLMTKSRLRALLLGTASVMALLTGCSTVETVTNTGTFPGNYNTVAYKAKDPSAIRV